MNCEDTKSQRKRQVEQATQGSGCGVLGGNRGVRAGDASTGGAGLQPAQPEQMAESAMPEHLAHLSAERGGEIKDRKDERRRREGGPEKPSRQHLLASTAPAPGPARGAKEEAGPGAHLLPGRDVRKKSMMRKKDHFVTLIFLLRRQIFYSTSFFFFFFCKNGIHEPIQNGNGTYGYGVSYTVTSSMYTSKPELPKGRSQTSV